MDKHKRINKNLINVVENTLLEVQLGLGLVLNGNKIYWKMKTPFMDPLN